jgi:GDPmannose 4,6-dehydratase
MKKALITGVSGQDGRLLTQLLMSMGYSVIGTSRNWQRTNAPILTDNQVDCKGFFKETLDCESIESWLTLIDKHKPDEIYHLSAGSSVGASFSDPWKSLVGGCRNTLAPLEALRVTRSNIRFFAAGSTEAFGDTKSERINENTSMNPQSPYGIIKAQTIHLLKMYRRHFGIWCCTGIFSNHESPLRTSGFVTGKIIESIRRIKMKETSTIKLGNVDVYRDWGWAPEYMQAAWLMLQRSEPKDYLIATGKSISLRDFATAAFTEAGLSFHDHLLLDEKLCRKSDTRFVSCDPSLISIDLGWQATIKGTEVAKKMYANSS